MRTLHWTNGQTSIYCARIPIRTKTITQFVNGLVRPVNAARMRWTKYVWPFELVNRRMFMTRSRRTSLVLATVAALFGVTGAPAAKAQQKELQNPETVNRS